MRNLIWILILLCSLQGCTKDRIKSISDKLVESEKPSYAVFYEKMLKSPPSTAILLVSNSSFQNRLWTPELKKEYTLTVWPKLEEWEKERISLNGILIKDVPNVSPDMWTNEINSLFNKGLIQVNKVYMNTRTTSKESIDFFMPNDIFFMMPYSGTVSSKPRLKEPKLHVKWNAQPENKNGVAIIVEYTGAVEGQLLKPTMPENERLKIGLFDDDGEALIDERYFEGIPIEAMIKIMLIRGNLVEGNLEGTPINIHGYTEEMGLFVIDF